MGRRKDSRTLYRSGVCQHPQICGRELCDILCARVSGGVTAALAGVAGETVCYSPFRIHFVHIGGLCVFVELEHCYSYLIEHANR